MPKMTKTMEVDKTRVVRKVRKVRKEKLVTFKRKIYDKYMLFTAKNQTFH